MSCPRAGGSILPSVTEPTRKPIVALAICGAVLVLPLVLLAPGDKAPETEEVVLAAGDPDEAEPAGSGGTAGSPEPAAEEAGDEAEVADTVHAAETGRGENQEAVAEVEDTSSAERSSGRQAAIVSKRPVKAKEKTGARTAATTKRSTATTGATAARAVTPPTTAPPPPPPPAPPPAPAPAAVAGGDGVWDKLAVCESGNTNDPGAPYYGYWQFSEATWHSVGEPGLPNDHARARQLAAAQRLQVARGWAPWPDCARRLGLL